MSKEEIEQGENLNLQFEKRGGLLPVIVQETSGQVLMLAYANQEALQKTIESKLATFYSTSREEIWTKGLTSGDYMEVKEIQVDCDQDSLLYLVELKGKGVCHTKNSKGETRKACFYRKLGTSEGLTFINKEE